MDSLLGKFRKRSLSHNSTSHSGALGSTKGGGGGDSRTKLLLEDQQELAGLIAAMRVQDGQLVELHTSLQGFLDTLRGACDHLGELTTTFKGLFKESGVSRAAVFGERWITLGHVMHRVRVVLRLANVYAQSVLLWWSSARSPNAPLVSCWAVVLAQATLVSV